MNCCRDLTIVLAGVIVAMAVLSFVRNVRRRKLRLRIYEYALNQHPSPITIEETLVYLRAAIPNPKLMRSELRLDLWQLERWGYLIYDDRYRTWRINEQAPEKTFAF